MAVYRNQIVCMNCGHHNSFQSNPRTLKQKLDGWVGDNGGYYPTKCSKCKKNIIKIEPIKLTKEQKEFLKTLGVSKKDKKNEQQAN